MAYFDDAYNSVYNSSGQSGGLTCDAPGCANPIAMRCNMCGRAMCVRHIQWIGTQGSYGSYTSGHYQCDDCTQRIQEKQVNATGYGCLALLAGIGIGALGLFFMNVGGVGENGLSTFGVLLMFGGFFTSLIAVAVVISSNSSN